MLAGTGERCKGECVCICVCVCGGGGGGGRGCDDVPERAEDDNGNEEKSWMG